MSSPRIIYYTSAQLFGECEHCTLSEDNAIVSSLGVSTDARPHLSFLPLYQSKVAEEWHMAPTENSWAHPLNQWYSDLIGDRYSRCDLTFKKDKLVAISGLAKLIHDKTSIPYFAGHWFPNETWFLSSLDWQRDSAGSKTREYRAPSWSWASQDSAVMFSGLGASFATLHSRLVHLSMNDNVKGPAATLGLLRADEPELVLEGPMLPLALRYIPYTNMWDVLKNADGSDLGFQFHYLDDDTEPPNGILSYALALTSRASIGKAPRVVCFLILEKVDPVAETPTMKRIGYGDASTDGEWAQKLLVAPVARVRTI